jgi:tetratricopeptide (TPR) repeat protein
MPRTPPPTSPQGPDRAWRIPPVPGHAAHAFAGAAVLEELDGPTAFALWQAVRDVHLWASTPDAERGRLFGGAARARAAPPEDAAFAELRAPLRVLAGIVGDAAEARPEEVAGACAAVARWAEGEGAMASALAFAEAAATASPTDAALACAAGRLARRCAEYARAETWFLRTAGLGRWSGDWDSYVVAFLGMGWIQLHRGSPARARRHFLRALRRARAHRLHVYEGEALHDLSVAAADAGDLAAAERWAREAYRAYGEGHPKLPRVAHDLAHIWLLQGFSARSLAVFRSLLAHFGQPLERLFVLADTVRAAGGAGDRPAFEAAWRTAWEMAGDPAARDGAARALLDMAHGAASLGDRERAERAAVRAIRVADERAEAGIRQDARALLDSLPSGSVDRGPAAAAPAQGEGDTLAAEIVRELNAVAAG